MLEAVASAAGTSYAEVRDDDGRSLAEVGPGRPCPGLAVAHCGTGGVRSGRCRGPRRGAPTGRNARLVTALAPHLAVVIRSAASRGPRPRTDSGHHRDPCRTRPPPQGPARRPRPLAVRHRARAAGRLNGASTPTLRPCRLLPTHSRRGRRCGPRDPTGARRAAPGSLDLHGLDGAVRDTASSLGMGQPGGPHFDLCGRPAAAAAAERRGGGLPDRRRVADQRRTALGRRPLRGPTCSRPTATCGSRSSTTGAGLGRGPRQGHGLDSMRRRAADVGGSLSVDPADPHRHARHRSPAAGGPA